MNTDITNILAVYGSILATIIFVWEIFKYIRDKPRLKIKVNYHILGGLGKVEHKIGITAINTGTKPIFIEAAGFELIPPLPDGHMATVIDPDLPQELQAGQKYTSHANLNDTPVKQIAYGWVRDATGKIWKSKKRPLKI